MSHPPETMLYVGHCRVCTTGPLGLRRCGGCNEIHVLCDECDAVWPDANLDGPPLPAVDGLLCPHCGADVTGQAARWATRKDVESCEWLTAELSAGRVSLEECEAYAPRVNDPPGDS